MFDEITNRKIYLRTKVKKLQELLSCGIDRKTNKGTK